MMPALKELEEYLVNQIAETDRSIRLYREGMERCQELRAGLLRSLAALRSEEPKP